MNSAKLMTVPSSPEKGDIETYGVEGKGKVSGLEKAGGKSANVAFERRKKSKIKTAEVATHWLPEKETLESEREKHQLTESIERIEIRENKTEKREKVSLIHDDIILQNSHSPSKPDADKSAEKANDKSSTSTTEKELGPTGKDFTEPETWETPPNKTSSDWALKLVENGEAMAKDPGESIEESKAADGSRILKGNVMKESGGRTSYALSGARVGSAAVIKMYSHRKPIRKTDKFSSGIDRRQPPQPSPSTSTSASTGNDEYLPIRRFSASNACRHHVLSTDFDSRPLSSSHSNPNGFCSSSSRVSGRNNDAFNSSDFLQSPPDVFFRTPPSTAAHRRHFSLGAGLRTPRRKKKKKAPVVVCGRRRCAICEERLTLRRREEERERREEREIRMQEEKRRRRDWEMGEGGSATALLDEATGNVHEDEELRRTPKIINDDLRCGGSDDFLHAPSPLRYAENADDLSEGEIFGDSLEDLGPDEIDDWMTRRIPNEGGDALESRAKKLLADAGCSREDQSWKVEKGREPKSGMTVTGKKMVEMMHPSGMFSSKKEQKSEIPKGTIEKHNSGMAGTNKNYRDKLNKSKENERSTMKGHWKENKKSQNRTTEQESSRMQVSREEQSRYEDLTTENQSRGMNEMSRKPWNEVKKRRAQREDIKNEQMVSQWKQKNHCQENRNGGKKKEKQEAWRKEVKKKDGDANKGGGDQERIRWGPSNQVETMFRQNHPELRGLRTKSQAVLVKSVGESEEKEEKLANNGRTEDKEREGKEKARDGIKVEEDELNGERKIEEEGKEERKIKVEKGNFRKERRKSCDRKATEEEVQTGGVKGVKQKDKAKTEGRNEGINQGQKKSQNIFKQTNKKTGSSKLIQPQKEKLMGNQIDTLKENGKTKRAEPFSSQSNDFSQPINQINTDNVLVNINKKTSDARLTKIETDSCSSEEEWTSVSWTETRRFFSYVGANRDEEYSRSKSLAQIPTFGEFFSQSAETKKEGNPRLLLSSKIQPSCDDSRKDVLSLHTINMTKATCVSDTDVPPFDDVPAFFVGVPRGAYRDVDCVTDKRHVQRHLPNANISGGVFKHDDFARRGMSEFLRSAATRTDAALILSSYDPSTEEVEYSTGIRFPRGNIIAVAEILEMARKSSEGARTLSLLHMVCNCFFARNMAETIAKFNSDNGDGVGLSVRLYVPAKIHALTVQDRSRIECNDSGSTPLKNWSFVRIV